MIKESTIQKTLRRVNKIIPVSDQDEEIKYGVVQTLSWILKPEEYENPISILKEVP